MSAYNFTERTPLERGFEAIFHRDIVPILRNHEKLRKQLRNKALIGVGATTLPCAAGATVAHLNDHSLGAFAAFFLGAICFILLFRHYRKKWTSGLASEVMPVICNFLGGLEYGGAPPSAAAFAELGLVSKFVYSTVEDTVQGTHHGLNFSIAEVELRHDFSIGISFGGGRGDTESTSDRILIQIELAAEVPSIYFAPARRTLLGEFYSRVPSGHERITTEFPKFEEYYETYTDDPEAARDFVNASLTTGLLDIARNEVYSYGYVPAATKGRGFYMALPHLRDFFSLGSLFRPLTVSEDSFHQCLVDLTLPRRVIDALGGG